MSMFLSSLLWLGLAVSLVLVLLFAKKKRDEKKAAAEVPVFEDTSELVFVGFSHEPHQLTDHLTPPSSEKPKAKKTKAPKPQTEMKEMPLPEALELWAASWNKRSKKTATLDEAVAALEAFLEAEKISTQIKKISMGSFFKSKGLHLGRERVDGKMVTLVNLPKPKK